MARSRTAQLATPEQTWHAEEPAPASRSRARPVRLAFRDRLLPIGAATACLLVLTAGLIAARSLHRLLTTHPRFLLPGSPEQPDTEHLEILGLEYTPRREVLAVFASDFGRSIYTVPLSERRRQLLTIDWIREASVSRLWPDRLRVRILERTPVAFALLPAGEPDRWQTALIDADGVLLRLPPRGEFTLPVLVGVTAQQPLAERRRRVALLLQVLAEAGPRAASLAEVDLTDPENVIAAVHTDGRRIELRLGHEQFAARLKNFFDYYPEMRRQAPEAVIFDLRVDGQIAAAPSPSASLRPPAGSASSKEKPHAH